jgi:peptide-methionine (S)-S-oxide reductase
VIEHNKIAILAGGCFWGMQDLIRKQPGVVSTRVGYTGGQNAHPTYRNHPGHAEAIEITYDPDQTDYRILLIFLSDPRPRTPLLTLMPRGCGPARWSPS